jgi:anti-sigma B factor antagonist
VSFFYISDVADEGVEYDDDVAVLIAGGEIDFAASPPLRDRLADHINAGKRRLILDLAMATFIDSTAIGVLVGATMRLNDAGGGSLTVICTSENRRVHRVFEIAGVENLIALHDSREEALSELAAAG